MRRSFEAFKLPSGFSRDPRFVMRLVIAILLLANLVAAFAVLRPFGGSAEELDAQLVGLRQQLVHKQATVGRLNMLTSKIEQARSDTDSFLEEYFMSRHTASSTILDELAKSAKDAGIKPKGDSFVFEPVEGSDNLSMMTIAANYEGTYGDLLQFVNKLDRSPRFLILESLSAAPQQVSGQLTVAIKLDTFVREDAP
jgi:Tfp pilus assembly protein PilO